jgi:exopolysaccharide biosynthesis polyprenyl glycosylphosphotransferase
LLCLSSGSHTEKSSTVAQVPDIGEPNTNTLAQWASSALTDVRIAGRTWRVRHRLPAGSEAAAAVERLAERPRISGLGLGERRLLQALTDWGVVTLGAFAVLVNSTRTESWGALLFSLLMVGVLWFFFAEAFNAYRLPVLQHSFRSAYTAAKVLIVTVVSYILLAWLLGGVLPMVRPRISETLLAALLIVIPLLTLRVLVSAILSRAPLRRRVVVVGANRDGYEMVEAIARYDGQTYEFMGFFDDTPLSPTWSSESNGVRPTADLISLKEQRGIDQVVLANPMQTGPLVRTLSLLHEQGTQITPMFALYQDLTGRVPVSHLGEMSFVALPANVKATTRTYGLLKRAIDFTLALLVLAVALPLWPLIALAIKLDSPGPVLFTQMRVGRGGKTFRILKFRSMRNDAEAGTGAVWAQSSDARVTRVGRFLRKSRLDEIPQLVNVIKGEMSFVGPRPERPEFDEELEREVPFYRARRAVRPGLTGWAQVNHGYGNTMQDALRKVEYDLYYIKNESLYLDLLILLRTVAVVLKLGGT